jgi:Holliday junction resolvasome RuvABC endonuclease subunit
VVEEGPRKHEVILGVDPGFANVGVVVAQLREDDGLRLLHAETVVTERDRDQKDRAEDDRRRVLEIVEGVMGVVRKYGATLAVLEAPSLPRDGRTKYVLGLAYGAMWGALQADGVEVQELRPQTIKARLTGCRGASKDHVEKVVRAEVAACHCLDAVVKHRRNHAADAAGTVLAWTWEDRPAEKAEVAG